MSVKSQLSRVSPLTIGLVIVFAAVMSYFIFQVFAASGTATLYTSPGGSQSVTNGQSFTVSVRVSSGASVPVTGASVYLSYPTDKLQVTGQSYAGSPYSTQLVASDSGGILRMDRAAFPMISGGDQLFAQVTFKAVATGSAALSFTGSSIVTSGEDDSNILAQRNGVTYNISAPASSPPASSPSSGGSSSSSPSGSTSGGGSSKSSTSSTGGTANSSTSSDTAAGGSGDANASTDNAAASASGEDGLTAGKASSTIAITILDSNDEPVEGAEVTINGQTVKTDKNGVAHFDSIPAGEQKVAVKYNGKTTDKVVHVKGASTKAAPEPFKISIGQQAFNKLLLLVIPALVLLAAGVFVIRARYNAQFATALPGEVDIDKIVTFDRPQPIHPPARPSQPQPVQPQPPVTSPNPPQPQPPAKAPGGTQSPGKVFTPEQPASSDPTPPKSDN